jgi:hypothetical protein
MIVSGGGAFDSTGGASVMVGAALGASLVGAVNMNQMVAIKPPTRTTPRRI